MIFLSLFYLDNISSKNINGNFDNSNAQLKFFDSMPMNLNFTNFLKNNSNKTYVYKNQMRRKSCN